MNADVFNILLARAAIQARPVTGGRVVSVEARVGQPGPRLVRLAITHPDGSRETRRAAASPRVRPAPSTPASRAWLAKHRATRAQERCTVREARKAVR